MYWLLILTIHGGYGSAITTEKMADKLSYQRAGLAFMKQVSGSASSNFSCTEVR